MASARGGVVFRGNAPAVPIHLNSSIFERNSINYMQLNSRAFKPVGTTLTAQDLAGVLLWNVTFRDNGYVRDPAFNLDMKATAAVSIATYAPALSQVLNCTFVGHNDLFTFFRDTILLRTHYYTRALIQDCTFDAPWAISVLTQYESTPVLRNNHFRRWSTGRIYLLSFDRSKPVIESTTFDMIPSPDSLSTTNALAFYVQMDAQPSFINCTIRLGGGYLFAVEEFARVTFNDSVITGVLLPDGTMPQSVTTNNYGGSATFNRVRFSGNFSNALFLVSTVEGAPGSPKSVFEFNECLFLDVSDGNSDHRSDSRATDLYPKHSLMMISEKGVTVTLSNSQIVNSYRSMINVKSATVILNRSQWIGNYPDVSALDVEKGIAIMKGASICDRSDLAVQCSAGSYLSGSLSVNASRVSGDCISDLAPEHVETGKLHCRCCNVSPPPPYLARPHRCIDIHLPCLFFVSTDLVS
eukprot:TRINITY_DN3675_c0_g1_i2.p1 TRINITY_DN3675_c0_g1~~TRINITY_DN3675_c0_g1_i2.p1  ORF type:complete len:502 (-),score=58.73 TRINITY_DN3675_c0_g1_i2:716-2119(-)